MSTTVLTVDSQPVTCAGVQAMLAHTACKTIGEASDLTNAAELAAKLTPNVILLDVRLGEEDGLLLLQELRNRSLPIPTLIFTASTNPTHAARALALGAAGLVSKSSSAEKLVASIAVAAAGGSCWPKNATRMLSGPLDAQGDLDGFAAPLTRREGEVLKQIALGLTNRDIAAALGISYETAKEHVQKVLRKMGANDRTQAAVWAVRGGLV